MVATTHHWRSALQVGSHHIARSFLGSGWAVGMVSAPLTPLHHLRRSAPDVADRFAARQAGPGIDGVHNIVPYTALPLIGPGFRSRWMLRSWPRQTVPSLARTLRRAGLFAPDLLLADSPMHSGLADIIEPRCLVFRIPDYTPGFRGVSTAWTALEEDMVRRADLVVCAARELESYASRLGARSTILVENGVDVAHISTPAQPPPEYGSIPSPRAIYVGALREWFDYALVNDLCACLPHVQFVIIGPERKASFAQAPNLHILGQRSRDVVPAYLQHADLGLIPFDRANHRTLVDGVNPLKLYEYCAAGLPVVSVRWPMLERIDSPALLAEGSGEFAEAVREALARREELAAQGRAFADSSSWDSRLQPLREALSCLG